MRWSIGTTSVGVLRCSLCLGCVRALAIVYLGVGEACGGGGGGAANVSALDEKGWSEDEGGGDMNIALVDEIVLWSVGVSLLWRKINL